MTRGRRFWVSIVAMGLTLMASGGCSLNRRPRPMPTPEQFVEARVQIESHVRTAEEVGVWEGSEGNRDGVGAGSLQRLFRYHSWLANDYPEDRGRVGAFISDVLVPGLLRACDATRRDLGGVVAGNIESIAGVMLQNRMALEKWAGEIEDRIVRGQLGYANLYWARTLHSGCAPEELALMRTRYEAILERCRARDGGCDPRIIESLEDDLRTFANPKLRKLHCE